MLQASDDPPVAHALTLIVDVVRHLAARGHAGYVDDSVSIASSATQVREAIESRGLSLFYVNPPGAPSVRITANSPVFYAEKKAPIYRERYRPSRGWFGPGVRRICVGNRVASPEKAGLSAALEFLARLEGPGGPDQLAKWPIDRLAIYASAAQSFILTRPSADQDARLSKLMPHVPGHWSAEEKQKVAQLRECGFSDRSIAKALKVDPRALAKACDSRIGAKASIAARLRRGNGK